MTKSIEHWKLISNMGSSSQKKFFEKKISDAFECRCVRLSDVFSKKEIEEIKKFVNPKSKMCYMNAYNLTNFFPKRVKYVEGEVTILDTLGIEHAWNLVDDKYYVDVTMELALNDPDFVKQEYTGLGTYDQKTICKVATKTHVYGGVYDYIELRRHYK